MGAAMGPIQDIPPAIRRLAPRPLGLHLAMAAAAWLGSPSGLPHSNGASPVWSRLSAADPALAAALARQPPEHLRRALGVAIRDRAAAFLRGLELYRRHGFRRPEASWPVLWREGSTRLLDCAPGSAGPAVLLVPSLVNRGYILDLLPERSFVRALAASGLHPMLLDWDRPGATERGWGLEAYIAGRLARCLDAVARPGQSRPLLLGYCMGGLLAAPLALLRPAAVAGLVLLAVPWDFHAERAAQARSLAAQARLWLPALDRVGEVPVDLLQALFALIDPLLALRKFAAFADLPQDGAAARDFVALEDWLNDGVPLAAPVAQETLIGWYGDNAPARGTWRIAGRPVRAQDIRVPSLVVAPSRDRIVPPGSARALAAAIPGATLRLPALGHVGMMASPRAPATLWPELCAWIHAAAAS